MRSIADILNLVKDGYTTTKEQAAAIVDEEVRDRAKVCNITEEEARKVLLANIGYCSGYLSHEKADQLNELFDTEHPVWGRRHPTPEEALRLGIEAGEKSRQKRDDE